jgi:hypothetical protein
MALAIRTRLGLAVTVVAVAAIATPVPRRPPPGPPLVDQVGLHKPDPVCIGCPFEDQAEAETLPWDESPAIPTTRFESRDGPLTLTVEVRPPTPAVGEPVRVRVVVTSTRPGLLSLEPAFGDEQPLTDTRVILDCAPVQPPHPGTIGRKTLVREVRFTTAGSHRVRAVAKVHSCRGSEDVDGGGFVVVRASRLPTNGPYRPVLTIEPLAQWNDVRHERGVTLTLRAGDDDGYVRRIDVDWGDGSPTETVGIEHDDCLAGPIFVRRPQTRWATHIYTRDGTYRVTATATSAGCDGRFRQVARAHYAVTLPRG